MQHRSWDAHPSFAALAPMLVKVAALVKPLASPCCPAKLERRLEPKLVPLAGLHRGHGAKVAAKFERIVDGKRLEPRSTERLVPGLHRGGRHGLLGRTHSNQSERFGNKPFQWHGASG